MSQDKLLMAVAIVAILCVTALVSQCSYRMADCQKEAIKAGMKAEDISKACHA